MIVPRFRFAACLSLVALLTGCGHADKAPDAPTKITYSHSGCFGTCPAFTIEVDQSGHGTFEGKAFTAVKGKRPFSVTPRQFAAFVNALEAARSRAKPFDPNRNPFEQSNADFLCPPEASYHTDDTGVFVIWRGRKTVYFSADYGCNSMRNRKLYDGIDDAPKTLGLQAMIGTPPPLFK